VQGYGLRDLQLTLRRSRVVVEGDALILVEIRKGQAGIAQVVLMKILRPIPGDAAAGVLRHQAAVGQVDGFQLAVAVLYAVAIERGAGRPGLAPLAPCSVVQDAQAAQLRGQVKEIVGDGQVFVRVQGARLPFWSYW
jgi:hypothetical protein